MLAPVLLNTTVMIAVSSYGSAMSLLLIGMLSPGNYAAELGSIFWGIFGSAMVQLWSVDQRRPNRKVMIADTMAGVFGGFSVPCLGIPLIVYAANYWWGLKGDNRIVFEIKDSLGITLFLACIAGMFSAGVIRRALDRFNPGWMGKNTNGTP